MNIFVYTYSVFHNNGIGGNLAGVVKIHKNLTDKQMLSISKNMNMSEVQLTKLYKFQGSRWDISDDNNTATYTSNDDLMKTEITYEDGNGTVDIKITCDDTDDNGTSDGGYGCPVAGTTISDYGVNIPDVGNNLSGYAWSERIGWISFRSADLTGCPSGTCSARRGDGSSVPDDEIHGWARILSIANAGANSGGFTGWIKLYSESGDPTSYGVKIDDSSIPKKLTGYAWSDEFGWIDFSRVVVGPIPDLVICPSSFTISAGAILDTKLWVGGTWGSVTCAYIASHPSEFTDVTSDADSSWVSVDPAIATVDNGANKGRVSGVSNGSVTITATYKGLTTNAYVTVSGSGSTCGDGVLDAGEACDDGASGNGACPATCSASCTLNSCLCTN